MSILDRKGQRRIAIAGMGVLAISLFGGIESASAIGPSRTTLTSSTPSIGLGGIAKLKAVVKPVTGTLQPTGMVTFREGTSATSPAVGPPVPLVLVNTVQTAKIDLTTLAVGTHTFIATYGGSADFTAGTSLTATIVVTAAAKGATSTTASSATPTPAPGQEVKLKAVVKQVSGTIKPTGSVTFAENGVALAAAVPLVLVGTVETAKHTHTSLPPGTHVITATYSGSTTFTSSVSSVTVTVAKVNTTTTVLANAGATAGKYTLVALVKPVPPGTGVATGIVTFTVDTQVGQPQAALNTTGRASVPGVMLNPGSHTVRASYPGDTGFNASPGTLTFTVPTP